MVTRGGDVQGSCSCVAAIGLALALVTGCPSRRNDETGKTGEPATGAGSSADSRAILQSVGATVAKLGAVPAWQAVVDRARYLERRGQRGIAYGVLGAIATAQYLWLIDDTEGNGALAIHVALPPLALATQGDRVALVGSWSLDETRAWFWRATTVTVLPAASRSRAKDPPAQAGHVIADGELPRDAKPISLAKEAERAYFSVVGEPPVLDGEGWSVADSPAGKPYALLNMVGERGSYGAQDLRAPSERWALQRGETYWVRIGPVHRRSAAKLATINARTAPVRVKLAMVRK